jgi:proteasome beta subunit
VRSEPNASWSPSAFLNPGTSSFSDFLAVAAPGLLPGAAGASAPVRSATGIGGTAAEQLPHGTTIVAAECTGGVVMAGDRRATAGSMIAMRDVEKVFRSDEYSCIGYSGTAGAGFDLIRLFQVELEHYEKLEGRALSLEGKANRLAGMVRANIGLAMQGLVVVPLFAGYDEETRRGRIFSYTVDGGRYEEHRFFSIGSGSVFARGSLKKLYRDDMPAEEVVLACMHALYDAADDDSATGGPDATRRIYPIVATVTEDGFRRLPDDDAGEVARRVIEERMHHPDGPAAPLPRPDGQDG